MRIHLGHHFYGAGNLGDDFMLAGFLTAMRTLAPAATYTCCVPFALEPLRGRFPAIEWLPYDEATRARCIAGCDVWLGLGGSPFQHAQSRWFVDHLTGEAARCREAGRPMYFLGIGVQSATELNDAAVRAICAQASAVWTRDPASAEYLAALPSPPPSVDAATDLAHVFFRETPLPLAHRGRLTVVANFDYGAWPGQEAFFAGVDSPSSPLPVTERVWLAQESRDLPGAERMLHGALPSDRQSRWRLAIPDLEPTPVASLNDTFSRWPSGEWLVTARFHAALASAWAGSKVAILSTNEKLRAAARELHCPILAPDADAAMVSQTLAILADGAPVPRRDLLLSAERAAAACGAFVERAARSTVAPGRRTT